MKTIRHILEMKGNCIFSIRQGASVFEALCLMAKKDVGALMVIDGEKLVGVISERDYARKIILVGRSSQDTLVSEIMSSPVHSIHPDQTIEEAMEAMTNERVRHLPVMENENEILGVITIGDVLRSILYFQREEINTLETCVRRQLETITELEECLGSNLDFRKKHEGLAVVK